MAESTMFDWPIIGHDKIKAFLQKNILKKSLAHAYIFYGPEKVGKTLMAKTLANTILCENYRVFSNAASALREVKIDRVPCGECEYCRQFQKKLYPDVYFVDREVNEKTGEKKINISVGQIRGLQEKLNKHAFQNSYKIAIISEADLMSQEASNSLLKTLEEPTEKTILILLTPNKNLLLPTIVSRCQTIRFLPITRDAIYNYLIEKGANRSLALELAGLAEGRPTIAMQLFTSSDRLAEYKKQYRELLAVLSMDQGERFRFVERLVEASSDDQLVDELTRLASLLRDLILIQLYSNDLLSHAYLEQEYQRIMPHYGVERLIMSLSQIEKTKIYIKQNVNPKLALENLIINI